MKASILLFIGLSLFGCSGSDDNSQSNLDTSAPPVIDPPMEEPTSVPQFEPLTELSTLLVLDNPIENIVLRGTTGSYITRCTADALPLGLTVSVLDDNSGCVISDTPTMGNHVNSYKITAENSDGSDSINLELAVMADESEFNFLFIDAGIGRIEWLSVDGAMNYRLMEVSETDADYPVHDGDHTVNYFSHPDLNIFQ